ncbi:MAG: hypothetical protein KDK36_02705, partial [Leptospiraceae bacterium]|nr:hypothetical protein [Leptospiraceae bacterium]
MFKNKIYILLVIMLAVVNIYAQEENQKKDLYVDKTTGQVFVEPGENRVKLEDYNNKNMKTSPISDPFFSGKKLVVLGRIQFR